ncbi:helix-turn-helix transcriptional regulator [Streptomyces katrae]|uniref:Helix-turn-helix transcriptional regulator n=1 Tax=Streptomyces katrae TaxID=68223 RepID=A0ABT7GVG6_9ACTN|nr:MULTISPECIES: helix-turn-helix transcriptional regulator [Streptomyces]MDK9497618.1 helix-turn-helix transcriptional regulator [Streptomyces katrae]RST08779.1 XRE family transcriptional regulator [Streptomyces sp. WAC07149]
MTAAFSVSAATAPQLAEAVARIADLAAKLGRSRDEVLVPEELHFASGVPLDVVRALLQGRPAGEPDIHKRFRQRLDLLHETYLKENGRKFSHGEIARQSGISRQQVQAMLGGDRRPTMDHCSRLERFFGRPAGFLQSEDTEALSCALAAVEKSLLQEYQEHSERGALAAAPAGPRRPSLYERHGVDGIALRAALLPDQGRTRLLEWLDNYMDERAAEGEQDPAGGTR